MRGDTTFKKGIVSSKKYIFSMFVIVIIKNVLLSLNCSFLCNYFGYFVFIILYEIKSLYLYQYENYVVVITTGGFVYLVFDQNIFYNNCN